MPNAMGIQKDRLQLARSRINLGEKAVFMEHLKGKKKKSDLPGKVRKQSAFLAEDMAWPWKRSTERVDWRAVERPGMLGEGVWVKREAVEKQGKKGKGKENLFLIRYCVSVLFTSFHNSHLHDENKETKAHSHHISMAEMAMVVVWLTWRIYSVFIFKIYLYCFQGGRKREK